MAIEFQSGFDSSFFFVSSQTSFALMLIHYEIEITLILNFSYSIRIICIQMLLWNEFLLGRLFFFSSLFLIVWREKGFAYLY